MNEHKNIVKTEFQIKVNHMMNKSVLIGDYKC